MDQGEILIQLNEIFMEELDLEKVHLSPATTANEVDGWDSLTHIQLVVAIEKHFKIRFTSKEIQSWKNVAELTNSIFTKLT